MHFVNLNCGVLPGFFSRDAVAELMAVMQKFAVSDGLGNDCHGVDHRHPGYAWFQKRVMAPIRQQFNPDVKLIYGMLLDSTTPFHLHDDIKPLPDPAGQHYASFLIPCAVDNDPDQCERASTIIFNQTLPRDPESMPDVDPDVSDIFDDKIGHVDPRFRTKLSVKKECIWHCGDLIWWDSQLAHVSSNFPRHGIKSKQSIVLHTYV